MTTQQAAAGRKITTQIRSGRTRRSSSSAYRVKPTLSCSGETDASGAFTPGCQGRHLPGYIEHLGELKAKGVDIIAFIATNDAFVMSAWGKVNKVSGEDIVRLYSSPRHTKLIISHSYS
jgi:hypothetical protein